MPALARQSHPSAGFRVRRVVTVETRPSSRQNFSLLISKEKSRDSKFARFRQLLPTIGQFFALSIAERILREGEKRPSASMVQGVRTGDVCILLMTRTPPQSLARLNGIRALGASMRPRRVRLGCSHPTSPWIPRQSSHVFDRWPRTMDAAYQFLHDIVFTMSKSVTIPTIYRNSSGCGVPHSTSPLESTRRIRNPFNQGCSS